MARRSYGSGSLFVRKDAAGREHWYGKWRSNGRQVKRKIGPKRESGSRIGLTRRQAEAELRAQIAESATEQPRGPVAESVTIAELGRRYMAHLKHRGRKPSTVAAVESALRVHLAPFFAERSVESIEPADVADLIATMEGNGLGPKSIANYIGTLGAMLGYAERKGYLSASPMRRLDPDSLPHVPEHTEIRFLAVEDVEALVAAAPDGDYQLLDRAMFLTAAMTGLRLGELIALRWQDVDWLASRIRVRRNHVMGEYGTPKSKRSSRSVPMADPVAVALDGLAKALGSPGDDQLVFPDPRTGGPLTKWGVLRRFRRALAAAKLDTSRRFHDLRHTFGTQMAAAGVPMRTLQEWMGHRDIKTTERYADYAPGAREAELIEAAFGGRGTNLGTNLSESERTSENVNRSGKPSRA